MISFLSKPKSMQTRRPKVAAAKQAMTSARHLSENDLKLNRGPGNLTPEQRKLWESAYGPKNEAFRKANLQGEELVKWKYQRYIKDYLRCVQSVDDNLGRVLDYLDKSGLAKNTIVIYSSDQGWYLGDHGWYDKRWMYEESLVMPLLIRWPGVVKPGSRNSDIVSNLDFAQTFLDIAGVKSPADMQGTSLVPLFKGHTPRIGALISTITTMNSPAPTAWLATTVSPTVGISSFISTRTMNGNYST